MSRLRLVPIIIILLISLAVLFGGWQAYKHYNLISPLQAHLNKIQGVQSVDVSGGASNAIVIHLGQVSDLQTTYDDITTVVTDALGSSNIRIEDNRTQDLTNEYEQLQPILFEGLQKGDYTSMITRVEQAGRKAGMDSRVTMDEHHVFIQLSKNNHSLYKVLSYSMRQGG